MSKDSDNLILDVRVLEQEAQRIRKQVAMTFGDDVGYMFASIPFLLEKLADIMEERSRDMEWFTSGEEDS